MPASTLSQTNPTSTSYEKANEDQLVEKTWEMFKSLFVLGLCMMSCLLLMGVTFSLLTFSIFLQGIFLAWVFYQNRWYILARYYVFTGFSIAYLLLLMRFGPDSYVYLGLGPIILGIISSFKTWQERYGISLVLVVCAIVTLQFGYTFSFVEPVESPEEYRLVFILITMVLYYDMTGAFLQKNREFRLRMKGMLRQIEEREINLQLNCRKEEEQIRQFEINNRSLETVIQNRMQVERGLSSSNEQLAQFSYAASHDLKEPLRSINSFIQLIQRKIKSLNDDILEQQTSAVISSSTKMSKLLDDLLEYSRISTCEQTKTAVNLGKVVNASLYSFQAALNAVNAKVNVSKLPTVFADRKAVEQIFSKLISNAIENRDEERPLVISISKGKSHHGFVEILVSDNGQGIDHHLREDVFGLFCRGRNQRKTQGSGIGLSTCRKIIQSFGGQIKFSSNTAEVGVTCIFTLPVMSPELN